MKRILPFLVLLAATVSSRAQLLDSQEFSAIGDTGVAVHGYIEFWQDIGDPTTGTIKLYVENFSVYRFLDNSLSGFENGIITAFGFDIGTGFTWNSTSFTEMDPALAIAGWATGTDAIDFAPEQPFFNSGVSMDIGGDSETPIAPNGLAGGYWTSFSFGFSTANGSTFFTDNFNADHFFSDADGEDLFFRFQAVSSNGSGTEDSDKVYVTWDPGGGGFDNPVPEPSTYGLIGAMALLALVITKARKR